MESIIIIFIILGIILIICIIAIIIVNKHKRDRERRANSSALRALKLGVEDDYETPMHAPSLVPGGYFQN